MWPTPILKPFLPGGSIGEINAQWLGGKVRLTYMDGMLGATCRTADAPDAPWSLPRIIATDVPAPYAPSLHPWNTVMESAAFTISSWPHNGNHHEAYGCYTYTANIEPPQLPKPVEDIVRSAYNSGASAVENNFIVKALLGG